MGACGLVGFSSEVPLKSMGFFGATVARRLWQNQIATQGIRNDMLVRQFFCLCLVGLGATVNATCCGHNLIRKRLAVQILPTLFPTTASLFQPAVLPPPYTPGRWKERPRSVRACIISGGDVQAGETACTVKPSPQAVCT